MVGDDMNIAKLKEELEQYFEYIKTIYINEYSEYLTDLKKEELINIKNIIVLNEELEFKIKVDKQITFNLNLEKYIKNNDLKNTDFSELDSYSREYINYLCNTDVFDILKQEFLFQVIKRLVSNQKDVIAKGTANMVSEYISQKYKLPYEHIIPSKEKRIAENIMKIVGIDLFYKSVLNQDYSLIEDKYNEYANQMDFKTFLSNINKIYQNYINKVGKVYLIDSLYEYNKIEYKEYENTKEATEHKLEVNNKKLRRLNSIKMALLDIKKHKILLTSYEQAELDTAILQIDKIIKKLIESQNEIDNVDIVYKKINSIENSSKKLLDKIWLNSLTNIYYFKENSAFQFLVVEDIMTSPIIATYITNNMIKDHRNFKLNYGYLIKPKENGIVYISTDQIKYQEKEDNSDIVKIDDKNYYVKMSEKSILQTPKMLENDTIRKGKVTNNIILDKKNIMIEGVYCFVDGEDEYNHNYIKASAMSEEYGVPLIKLNIDEYISAN